MFSISGLVCYAGTLQPLTTAELVSQSETIVSGTVTRTWTSWDNEHRFIWTHAAILVDNVLKGSPSSVVTVSEPGGVADGLTMQVPGSTPYATGERVHVFLYRTPLTYMRTVGYGQGKFIESPSGRVHSAVSALLDPNTLDGLTPQQFRVKVKQIMGAKVGAISR